MAVMCICIGVGWIGIWTVPRLAVAAIVMIIGVLLLRRRENLTRDIMVARPVSLGWDRPLTSAHRRRHRSSLDCAIKLTMLRSLFPRVVSRCEHLLGSVASSL